MEASFSFRKPNNTEVNPQRVGTERWKPGLIILNSLKKHTASHLKSLSNTSDKIQFCMHSIKQTSFSIKVKEMPDSNRERTVCI